jgi:hypothetical protein
MGHKDGRSARTRSSLGGGWRCVGVSLMTNPCAVGSVAIQDARVKATNCGRCVVYSVSGSKTVQMLSEAALAGLLAGFSLEYA